jgi:hypothetical protein
VVNWGAYSDDEFPAWTDFASSARIRMAARYSAEPSIFTTSNMVPFLYLIDAVLFLFSLSISSIPELEMTELTRNPR